MPLSGGLVDRRLTPARERHRHGGRLICGRASIIALDVQWETREVERKLGRGGVIGSRGDCGAMPEGAPMRMSRPVPADQPGFI